MMTTNAARDTRPYQTSDVAEVPPFAREWTVRDGYLILTEWKAYTAQFGASRTSGYQLGVAGLSKLTKRGSLGALKGCADSGAMHDGFAKWVEAGRPADWTLREW